MSDVDKSKKIGKWYFGGLASAGAACCTHPLDLLKVHLQTAGIILNSNFIKFLMAGNKKSILILMADIIVKFLFTVLCLQIVQS